jgi:ParB family transcriptional regulator, chromosome partitioning protein
MSWDLASPQRAIRPGVSQGMTEGHDGSMRMLWTMKKSDRQLALLGLAAEPGAALSPIDKQAIRSAGLVASTVQATPAAVPADGRPMLVGIDRLDEDPTNPRTEFSEPELDELADDIRQRGVLQPLVVQAADARSRYRIHFGAKRLRAAQRAGLPEVPVVIRDAPADPYAQVAENQKRHGLAALDLACFIKDRVAKGDSNAFSAKQLGINLTTVAHHLSLLDLPPALDQALKTGRCTSPRTLDELSKLHETEPEKVRALVGGDVEITRSAVAAMKAERSEPVNMPTVSVRPDAITRAHAACGRLEQALAQIERPPESPRAARTRGASHAYTGPGHKLAAGV